MKYLSLFTIILFLPFYAQSPILFSQHPELSKKIPHCELGFFPTPVHPLTTVNNLLNAHLYIKRDDLSGIESGGMRRYGGNKVRKLEFLLADACAHNVATVMTFGCAGSNHAVATSLYAQHLGLRCAVLLKPQANSHNVQKNLLLHQYCGTTLYYYQSHELRRSGAERVYEELTNKDGVPPYVIPTGGSCPLGALGFVNAAFELKEQIKTGQCPEPHYIYVACGSCGTTAGLLLGCNLAQISSIIVCVAVEPENEVGSLEQDIKKLFYETNELLHRNDPTIPLVQYPEKNIVINTNHTGIEYGVFTEEGLLGKNLLQEREQIALDGTYAAKAFAALLHERENMNGKTVLFWNTFCDIDVSGLIDWDSYKNLPIPLHPYFEQPTQLWA